MKSDTDLMIAFAAGDEAAFDELVERHHIPLINFFFKMVWDRHVAEDLSQEVFVKLHCHRQGYQPRAKFTTFLYRVARNCAVDYLRRHKHERGAVSLDAPVESGSSLQDQLVGDGADPTVETQHRELGDSIRDALATLPEEHRTVFVLSEVQGLKYAEISEVLDVPVGTIKSRMHNATKRLRDALVRAGVVSGEHEGVSR
jgi:RNA polymerase sigma-70 factor (ECF subfamily)